MFYFLLLICHASMGCHKATPPPPIAAAPMPAPSTPSPPTITLTADRTAIPAGESVMLMWQSTGATSVTLDNAIGDVSLNGSRRINPPTSTSYTATARGIGGTATSAAVRVTVNPIPPATAAVSRVVPQPVSIPTLAEQFQTAMQNILFDYDESHIRASEIPKLRIAAQFLKKNLGLRFTIEGNADERGSQEYNIALGDERAAAVKQFLVGEGLPAGQAETISYGEERPLCRDLTEACWQRNRRAQFMMRP
jgi:peptidoglycan-associated lipoprotein